MARAHVARLGLVSFQSAWELQRRLVELRAAGEIPDTLLLLEHPHSYTLGRTADESNIRASPTDLAQIGAEVFRIDRGGDVTYHGPGQLVGYPIMFIEDRRNLLQYIRKLEEVIIRALAGFGIDSGRIDGLSGVWVGEEKIAAIGVKIGRVTSHGFALNVSTDMTYFRHIVPCGIRDKGVTSIRCELERQAQLRDAGTSASVTFPQVVEAITEHFGDVFEREMVSVNLEIEGSKASLTSCSAHLP